MQEALSSQAQRNPCEDDTIFCKKPFQVKDLAKIWMFDCAMCKAQRIPYLAYSCKLGAIWHGDGFFEPKTRTKGVSDWVVVGGTYIKKSALA